MNSVKTLSRMPDGTLPTYALPGLYPLYYLDAHNEVLCSECATYALDDPHEYNEFRPQTYHIHYEGAPLYCSECGARIESAYGDPWEEKC